MRKLFKSIMIGLILIFVFSPIQSNVSGEDCSDPLGCVTIPDGNPVKIAAGLAISGPASPLGEDSQYGVEIAIEERGNLLGHPIDLWMLDSGCSAEGGQTTAQTIVGDEDVVAVVGFTCSSANFAGMDVLDASGYTMISPSSTAVSLTDPDSTKSSFMRTVLSDQVQGEQFAKFTYSNLGLQSAATIDDGGTYSEDLADSFASAFEGYGGSITAQSKINYGDTDMRPMLESIAPDEPGMLYYPVYQAEAGFITKQTAEVTGLENTQLASADAAFTDDFLDASGTAAEGMYVTTQIPETFSSPAYTALRAKVIAKSGGEPQFLFHAYAYDATNMILDSIEDVAVKDSSGNLVIGRKALRDALYATSGYQGVSGILTCDQYGDCGDPANFTIFRIENGEFVKMHEIPGISQMFLPMISNRNGN